jgi:hypothetical protein
MPGRSTAPQARRNLVTMADIWLTAAAEAAFRRLQATTPSQAAAVRDAIDDIAVRPGRPMILPGLPPGESFFAKEPRDPKAPAVIYRDAASDEEGRWLVVSLLDRNDYHAARRAEKDLATYPPEVRNFVNAVVAGTVSTVTTNAPPGEGTGIPHSAAASTAVPSTPRHD